MGKKIVFFIFLTFCYFSFFLRLTSYPLLMWDESRFAVNAFEMLKSGNFLVVTYDGMPDLWNTKPPLNIWIMSLFMKCFGHSELIIRLPSAIAATVTAVAVFLFVYKHLKDLGAAFFSGMVLISSIGFIGMHVARTGDADALMVMFMTLFVIFFFKAIEGRKENDVDKRSLYLSGLFFSLALLTKSSYAFFILPGLLVFLFVISKFYVLKNRHFYFAFLLSLIPLLSYYIVRENLNPGYLKAVWENEFGGRFSSTLEQHSHPFYFYFMQLLKYRFFYWFYIVIIGISFLFFLNNKKESKLVLLCALAGFSILLIISFSNTKLDWYDAGVYPFFSIVCGIVLTTVAQWLAKLFSLKKPVHLKIFFTVFFLVLFFYPYRKILSYINIKPAEAANHKLKYGPFMKQLYQKYQHNNIFFYETGYNAHLLYYTKVYSEKGRQATIITKTDGLNQSAMVATCENELKNAINSTFRTRIVMADKYCTCFEIFDKSDTAD